MLIEEHFELHLGGRPRHPTANIEARCIRNRDLGVLWRGEASQRHPHLGQMLAKWEESVDASIRYLPVRNPKCQCAKIDGISNNLPRFACAGVLGLWEPNSLCHGRAFVTVWTVSCRYSSIVEHGHRHRGCVCVSSSVDFKD